MRVFYFSHGKIILKTCLHSYIMRLLGLKFGPILCAYFVDCEKQRLVRESVRAGSSEPSLFAYAISSKTGVVVSLTKIRYFLYFCFIENKHGEIKVYTDDNIIIFLTESLFPRFRKTTLEMF